MIKWGIVGLGNMASVFANAINDAENSELIGIASNSKDKLEIFQKKYKIKQENKYTHYKDLINSENIDAIYIATLNNTHVDLILECVKKNKKILCEKPIGLDQDQANLALKSIKKNDTAFYEAIAYRSHIQTEKIIELVNMDEIGDILKIEAFFGFKVKRINKRSRLFDKDLGGGAILDVGCYPISFFNLFCKKNEQLKIIKSQGTFSFTGVDDQSEAQLLIGKNIKAYCKVSLKENLVNSCKIYGTKGTINVPCPWLPAQKTYIEIENKNSYYKKFITSEKSLYAIQIETVSNLFLKKTSNQKNCVNIDESLEIMKILDAWKKSIL
jgi:predicted dehydrogenase